jgi:hypothetical protein
VFTASIITAIIALMIEAVSTSEMSVNFYQTSWCNIPEGGRHLHTFSTSVVELISFLLVK